MEMKDILAVSIWLRGRCSLADVEAADPTGLLGNTRFTPQAVRLYRLLWLWSGFRSGPEHDRAWERLGSVGYARRLARCQKWIAKFSQ